MANPGAEATQRMAFVAKLRPGSTDDAASIIARGAPYDLDEAGFERHYIFLASDTVVFLFEGTDVERRVRDLLNDPAQASTFGVWGPVLDGTPVLAREEFS